MFTFSVKLEKWSFHIADLPRTGKAGLLKFKDFTRLCESCASLMFIYVYDCSSSTLVIEMVSFRM